MISFELNGDTVEVDAAEDMPLLWVLRDLLNMTGTKFGCGIANCGACTVHVEGEATRACVLPLGDVAGLKVTTIEGLKGQGGGAHPVQQAWLDHQVPQCGYCQSGMIMAAAALIAEGGSVTDETISETITNVCRCGTYPRIRAAIKDAADRPAQEARYDRG
ncbi:MAG: (2Fe-2S)-binding protein [Alphaproteobacteria bacterium]